MSTRAPEFFDPRIMISEDDPYPVYRHFREEEPVHRSRFHAGWYLFRHGDAMALLGDERFVSDKGEPALERFPKSLRPMMTMRRRWMMERDPPEHTRLRTPVARTFTPRRVSVLTSEFEALADRLLDDCLAMGRFDAMRDYALPLVHGSMARMSGIPEERHVRFSEGVRDIETIDNTRESVERMATAVEQMGALFGELLSKRRARPRDDLISAIAAVEQDALDWEDRVATCVLIISAAAGVTVGAIGNSLRALLDNPGECKRFRDGSAAPGDAVEELLRFDPTPVGLVRSAREDLVAFDVHVKKGEQVIALVGAANRDPEAFDEPDRVDLTRRPLTHLAFGHGRHFCLGASLARAQVGVALQRLLERAPNIQRTPDSLAWRGGLQRVLSSLRVSV